MPTLAVCNLKGGVGKTTTTFNVAAALAEMGHHVLLIDADAHCSLTSSFDLLGAEPTLADVLRGRVTVTSAAHRTHVDDVWLVPASPDLDEINRRNLAGERVLLARLGDAPGYTLIDCPPSVGVTLANALVAADDVLAPVQTQGLAQGGIERLLRLIRDVRGRSANSGLDLVGILVNKFDRRTKIAWRVLRALRDQYGPLVFDTLVHESVALAESTDSTLPVVATAGSGRAAREIRAVARELVQRSGVRQGHFGRVRREPMAPRLRVVQGQEGGTANRA